MLNEVYDGQCKGPIIQQLILLGDSSQLNSFLYWILGCVEIVQNHHKTYDRYRLCQAIITQNVSYGKRKFEKW